VKTRDYQELRKKSASDIEQVLAEKRTEVFNLRFSAATGALENTAKLAAAKRDVARVLTLLGEKQREEATSAASSEVTA
jgi:large subunit ribosomal protein L29